MSLRPEDADFVRELVSVRAGYAKNGEGRSVPLTTTFQKISQRLGKEARQRSSCTLFRNQHGAPLRISALYKAFVKAVEQAGIKDFHFHDLRHTFASRLVMAGVDLRTVQELMGHKDIKMTLRYAHLSPGHRRKAVEMLEAQFSEKSPVDSHNTPIVIPLPEMKKAV